MEALTILFFFECVGLGKILELSVALYGFECQEEGRSSEFGQGISEFLDILIEFKVGDVGFVL